jgi:hypothetical protein
MIHKQCSCKIVIQVQVEKQLIILFVLSLVSTKIQILNLKKLVITMFRLVRVLCKSNQLWKIFSKIIKNANQRKFVKIKWTHHKLIIVRKLIHFWFNMTYLSINKILYRQSRKRALWMKSKCLKDRKYQLIWTRKVN